MPKVALDDPYSTLSPEMAGVLDAIREKAHAPKKPRKVKAKGKPRVERPRPAPQHNAHVLAAWPHLILRRAAELSRSYVPAPYIAALGPEGWSSSAVARDMHDPCIRLR